MEAVPTNIKQIILDLASLDKSISASSLADLSNLKTDEICYFEQVWPTVAAERRLKIISLMVELAEENFELNFDSIFKTALRDKDEQVRSKAIDGLWENEEPALIHPLVRMLNEDKSEKVQAAAAAALGKFALLAELKKLRASSAEKVTQALMAILNDKSKPQEVWRRALEAASPLSVPEVREAIKEAYKSGDPKLKSSAIFAMGKNCDPVWIPILLKELASVSSVTRYEAAGACGELGCEEAVPLLIKLSVDQDIDVQLAAIQALGKIGGLKAKQHLKRFLENADEAISEAAKQALEQIQIESEEFRL
jgi:HEAT repeat protein